MRTWRGLVAGVWTVAVAVGVGACAGGGGAAETAAVEPEVVPNQPFSGFLGDYAGLKPSPTHEGAWYEQREGLRGYRRFIVEPVKLLARETVRGRPIDQDTARGLGDQLHREVVKELTANDFEVVKEPGPGVARIRAAVTRLARSQHTEGKPQVVGGGEIEVEIVDSVTGQRLGAAVEHDVVDPVDAKETDDPYADVRLVFHHWSARLGAWLRQVREGEAR